MFPTRRLKAESPYFSKILMRAPARQFSVPRARKVKTQEKRLSWSPEISGMRARQHFRKI